MIRLRLALLPLFAASLAAQPALVGPIQSPVSPGSPSRVLYAWFNGLVRSDDGGANWRPLYVTESGRPQPPITGLVIDPSNDSVLYLATDLADDPLWKSADAGDTWIRAARGLPREPGGVRYLRLAAAEPSRLYALIGVRLYRSSDGAATWQLQSTLPVPSLSPLSRLDVSAPNPSTMYFADRAQFSRSLDEGASWTSSFPFGSDAIVSQMTSDPASAGTVYLVVLGAGPLSGLVRSQDAGDSFTRIGSSRSGRLYLDPAGRPILYLAGAQSDGGLTPAGLPQGVCRSGDRGANFECQTLARGDPGVTLFIDPRAPDIVYAATNPRLAEPGLFRSADAGRSWQPITGVLRPTLARPAQPVVFRLVAGATQSQRIQVATLELPAAAIPFAAAVSGANWLTLNRTSGVTPAEVTLTAATAGLAPGSYEASVRLSSPQASNVASVPVQLLVDRVARGGPAFVISTLAGNGRREYSGDGGPAVQAGITSPTGIAFDPAGNLLIAAPSEHRVRRVRTDGRIETFAGTGAAGFSGDGGPPAAAMLNRPRSVAVDSASSVYIIDVDNTRLRRVSGGVIGTLLDPQTRIAGFPFFSPTAVAVEPAGGVLVAAGRRVIRLAAAGGAFEVATSPLTLTLPSAVAASQGSVFIADANAHRVIRVPATGDAVVVAGIGVPGSGGDGGPATQAALNSPGGLAIDEAGNLYIADTLNSRIRVVDTTGAIYTVAGTGAPGFSGDGGAATDARLNWPRGLALDREGNLHVAEELNFRVRKLTRVRAPAPQVAQEALVNAGSNTGPLSPGSLFSAYGANLATATETAAVTPWPLSLAGATVTIDGRLAPLFFAGPGQVNGQIPYETGAGTATAVFNAGGVQGSTVRFEVSAAAPGILTFGANRAVAVNPTGEVNTEATPAAPGSVLVVYLTGIGAVDNPVPTGAPAGSAPLSRAAFPFQATIGGRIAAVAYLGLAPGFVGLAQANLVVPDLPPGNYAVIVTVNDVASNDPLISVSP